MSPDWQGFMQLNTIIRDSEWAALWSRGSFFRIKLGFSPCVRSRPASSYCLWKVPKRQPWGHGPHCARYKQGLPEKEARFLSSRKSFLLSWNLKIPEGMKGQGRNEWRGRESWLVRSWRGNSERGGTTGAEEEERPKEPQTKWRSVSPKQPPQLISAAHDPGRVTRATVVPPPYVCPPQRLFVESKIFIHQISYLLLT